MNQPESFSELRRFYREEYRPLYNRFVTECNVIPQELHNEASAALDHLMRECDESVSPKSIAKASGHLKRATFDAFKLLFDEIRKKYIRLNDSKYRDVWDGEFLPKISDAWNKARKIANTARAAEIPDDDMSWACAFDEWKKILEYVEFFNTIENDKSVIRASRMSRRDKIWRAVIWICTLALGWGLCKCFDWCLNFVRNSAY